MTINLITATHSDFSSLVGQSFFVETDNLKLELVLDNVKVFDGATIRDNHLEIGGVVYPPRTPFALTFVGPNEPVLATLVYELMHDETGPMNLLLSPFQQTENSILYESNFS